jgi:hypothetical protein
MIEPIGAEENVRCANIFSPAGPCSIVAERRWIVLSDDGRHVTLGRHSDPTPEELREAGEALHRVGLGGWLAVMEGTYYRNGTPVELMMVRELATPKSDWTTAVSDFRRLRSEATSSPIAKPPLQTGPA